MEVGDERHWAILPDGFVPGQSTVFVIGVMPLTVQLSENTITLPFILPMDVAVGGEEGWR